MNKKLYSLAELTQDLETTIQGDASCLIQGVCTIQEALPGHITFLTNPLYKKFLPATKAAAVILSASDAAECATNAIISRDPYYTYAKIAAYFAPGQAAEVGIHPSAVIGLDCKIDPTASIGPHTVIGDGVVIAAQVHIAAGCVIGDGVTVGQACKLDARVTIYHGTKVGRNVSIASGTVIGSDGFGYAKHKGKWQKVPQLGRVIIEDHVEIGANCCIDRGAVEDTVIESGVIIDNLIQIGHNVRVGANTAIAGCVGIAGSAVIGKNCLIGGGTGVAGHINIADNVMLTGMTAVTKSIREPGVYSSGVGGVVTNLEWRKNSARVHKLDQMSQRIKVLEAALAAVTERK